MTSTSTEEAPPLAANLHALKSGKGCTWREVAAAVGTTERNVAKWAIGDSLPQWRFVVALAAYFDLPDPGALYLRDGATFAGSFQVVGE